MLKFEKFLHIFCASACYFIIIIVFYAVTLNWGIPFLIDFIPGFILSIVLSNWMRNRYIRMYRSEVGSSS